MFGRPRLGIYLYLYLSIYIYLSISIYVTVGEEVDGLSPEEQSVWSAASQDLAVPGCYIYQCGDQAYRITTYAEDVPAPKPGTYIYIVYTLLISPHRDNDRIIYLYFNVLQCQSMLIYHLKLESDVSRKWLLGSQK